MLPRQHQLFRQPARKSQRQTGARDLKRRELVCSGSDCLVASLLWLTRCFYLDTGVADMTLLSKVGNEQINDNLRERYLNREMYTYIGYVLIRRVVKKSASNENLCIKLTTFVIFSVNPFQDLGIYTDEIMESYHGKNLIEARIWAAAYPIFQMIFFAKNISITDATTRLCNCRKCLV